MPLIPIKNRLSPISEWLIVAAIAVTTLFTARSQSVENRSPTWWNDLKKTYFAKQHFIFLPEGACSPLDAAFTPNQKKDALSENVPHEHFNCSVLKITIAYCIILLVQLTINGLTHLLITIANISSERLSIRQIAETCGYYRQNLKRVRQRSLLLALTPSVTFHVNLKPPTVLLFSNSKLFQLTKFTAEHNLMLQHHQSLIGRRRLTSAYLQFGLPRKIELLLSLS